MSLNTGPRTAKGPPEARTFTPTPTLPHQGGGDIFRRPGPRRDIWWGGGAPRRARGPGVWTKMEKCSIPPRKERVLLLDRHAIGVLE